MVPAQRSKGVEAIITPQSIRPTNDGARFTSEPPWWSELPSTIGDLQLGHLIASKHGGPGGSAFWNMVPQARNTNHPIISRCESLITAAAQCGQCVLVEIRAKYDDPKGTSVHPMIPYLITIRAEGTDGFGLSVDVPNAESGQHLCPKPGNCDSLKRTIPVLRPTN